MEVTFNTPVTRDGHGPRYSLLVGQKLSDYQDREHGEDTFELTRLGPAGLETVDTLIMAGVAATRAEAIRWVLDRIREWPAYERLRDHVHDTGRLKADSRPRRARRRLMTMIRSRPGSRPGPCDRRDRLFPGFRPTPAAAMGIGQPANSTFSGTTS